MQSVEAELRKTNQELGEIGQQKLDVSHDVVSLNTEINKKERELVGKVKLCKQFLYIVNV